MIVYKEWKKSSHGGLSVRIYQGWFLFGLLPLYVRRIGYN